MRQELHAVADPENGNAQVQMRLVDQRSTRIVDARRPAGQDEPFRPEGLDLFEAGIVGEYLAIDLGLAYPAGDQLGILGPEVEDQDSFTVDIGHGRPLP